MTKLQNISGLLVAVNSDYSKDVVVTTKTTRAELTKMLQATESALVEVLPRMEGYASKVEDMTKDKQDLSNQVGKLIREVIELKGACESHEEQKDFLYQQVDELKESNSKSEGQKDKLHREVIELKDACATFAEQREKLEATLAAEVSLNKNLQQEIDKIKQRSFFERLFNKV